MEGVCSSETSVRAKNKRLHHIPEDGILHRLDHWIRIGNWIHLFHFKPHQIIII
jgi:hypothetical protein